jgi:hypothetical protein
MTGEKYTDVDGIMTRYFEKGSGPLAGATGESSLNIDLLVMSLRQPASGRSPDPWPRAGTSRRGGGRLSDN